MITNIHHFSVTRDERVAQRARGSCRRGKDDSSEWGFVGEFHFCYEVDVFCTKGAENRGTWVRAERLESG